MELAYFFVTVASGCHWPIVLWLRVPTLIDGGVIFLQNAQHFINGMVGGSGGWVSTRAKRARAEIFYPCKPSEPGAQTVVLADAAERDDDDEGCLEMPGHWVRTWADVLLEPEPMALGRNPAGAMRDVYHMFVLAHAVCLFCSLIFQSCAYEVSLLLFQVCP